MNTIHANDGDVRYVRVSKVAARKAFDAGKVVVLCPVRLYPFGSFRPSCMIDDKQEGTFDALVRNFEWYNCQLNETGYYASFYVRAV